MPSLYLRWTVATLVALLLSGCVPDSIKTSEARLQETLRRYESTARWGSLQLLYGFLKPELADTVQIPEGLENVRVTGYETVTGPTMLSETRAAQSTSITFVLQDRQVVKSLIDNQIWERDEESGDWRRANPIPSFR